MSANRSNGLARALVVAVAVWTAGYAHADGVVYIPTLNTEGAKAIAAAALGYAREHQAPGAAVAVVDSAGVLLYLEKLDGTFQNAAEISVGKARTAALFGKPTRAFEDIVNKGRYSMLAVPSVAPFTPLMGGVPIEINHRIAGAVGVSGAASAAQDDEIATAAAALFAEQQKAGTTQVTHVPAAKVAAAFLADATLVTEPGFRVNASRRDGPGEAEVHRDDTDIFYVQQGTAELVTGGELIAAHNLSPTEIRGSGIQGGEAHSLTRGDVVTIPRGVPHWFRQVKAPFTYLVVKSSAP